MNFSYKIRTQSREIIEGKIEGNISCTSVVKLMPSAIVRGEIRAPRIDVQPGARIDGALACKS